MVTMRLDYLNVYTVRRGGRALSVAYYRRDGVRRRVCGADGKPVDPNDGPALLAAWTAVHQAWGVADACAATATERRIVTPRSIADLIRQYKAAPEWSQLGAGTRADYLKALLPLETDFGHFPVNGLHPHHVIKMRDRYAWRTVPDPATPGATIRVSNAYKANKIVTVLSILMSFAVRSLGWRTDNPALRPGRLRIDTEGHRPWTQAEFLRFMEYADADWQFNALFALLTAQRGQDQVKVAWTDYDGTSVYVVQQKGRRTVKLWIEAHPVLKLALDRRQKARLERSPVPLTILARPDGTQWPVNGFQKAAGAAIRAAGLEGIVWHGLRATGTSWSADGGATDKMLQALTGHKTLAMVGKYSRGANQRDLAASAVRAIVVPIAPGVRVGKKRTTD